MTEQEKNAQLGEAVLAYQQAKQECAHIDKKIETIFAAYRSLGETMDRNRGTITESRVLDGKLEIGWRGGQGFREEHILNAEELKAVLLERDKRREELKRAEDLMKGLGGTDLR